MSPEKQKIADRIKHISQAGFIISFALVIVLQLIPSIWHIEWPQVVNSIIKNTVITLFFLSFATLLVSSFWSTDDEKEERKAEFKEVMQEIREEEIQKKRKKTQSKEEVACPLIDVNDRQREAIIELLKRRITTHEKDVTRFNRSVVYAYLTALRAAHVITLAKTDEDRDERRRWIEQITGLYEPQNEWAHFRGDYDESKTTKKAREAKKEIENILEKFR